MKQLIDLFNKKYGKQYGVIDDSFSNEDIYKIYKIIKTLCSDDAEIMELLDKVKLPSPKTAKESIEKININIDGGKSNDIPHVISEETILTIPASDVQKLINDRTIEIMFGGTFDINKVYYAEYNGGEYKTLNIADNGKGLYFSSDNFYIELDVGFDLNWNEDDTKTRVAIYDPNNITEALDIIIKTKEIQYLNNHFINPNLKDIESIASSNSTGEVGKYSIAFGTYCNASGEGACAFGLSCKASNKYSHAEGNNNESSGMSSHVEGSFNIASGHDSHAEGSTTRASNYCSHAEGGNTTASGGCSHAEGSSSYSATSVILDLSSSTTNDTIINKWNNKKFSLAKGEASHVEGKNNLALGGYSHAEGIITNATGYYSHAEGNGTVASGEASHAEGAGTIASGNCQHVEGGYNINDSENNYLHIVGNGANNNNRSNAHTLDWEGNAWYAGEVQATNLPYKISETTLFELTKEQLEAGWRECQAGTDSSIYIEVPIFEVDDDCLFFIELNNNTYRIDYIRQSTGTPPRWDIEFYNMNDVEHNIMGGYTGTYYDKEWNDSETTAIVKIDRLDRDQPPIFTSSMSLKQVKYNTVESFALEKDLDVYNSISIKRKVGTKIGESSFAVGRYNTASAIGSHAEGDYTTASGFASHTEGSNTIASSSASHAEGDGTTASGSASHAEGDGTTASGNNSHSEGNSTIAKGENQHVQGKYNIEDTENKYAHIVGNGKYDYPNSRAVRSNAHTLDWKGNAWYQGKLSQDGTPTEDKDLTTKKYVDDKIVLLSNAIITTNQPINQTWTLTTDKMQTGTVATDVDIILPTVDKFTEIHLFFDGYDNVNLTTGATSVKWKTAPNIVSGKLYEITFIYLNDTLGWIADIESYSTI
ncbi:MAG: hypothetical protein ACI32Z_07875 [Clostridium sp.]